MERGFLMEKKKCSDGKEKKRKLVIAAAVLAAAAIIALLVVPGMSGESNKVNFQQVEESKIPMSITSDVIPEYKTMERALACVVDDDVYVLVTRGEKPSSGFGVSVDKIILENEDDKNALIVYAEFDDPGKETPVSQIITYPMCIVKTDLTRLPDTIELRIEY